MKININDVLEAGLSFDLKENGAELIEMALGQVSSSSSKKAGALGFAFLTPISVHLDLTRIDENLLIIGSLTTELGLQCGKCTKDFPFSVASDFTYCAPVESAEADNDEELDLESALEALSNHIDGDELDVTALLLEVVSLEVPLKPQCDKRCKGLCLNCGIDLNENKCDCADKEAIDPRLAGLKEFRVKK